LWIFQIHPLNKCLHAGFLKDHHTDFPNEKECLFVPYSVFTVVKIEKEPSPKKIYLKVAVDNMEEREDLPLSPWI